MVGHFGRPAIIAAVVALVAMVLHLAVPFGVDDFDATANEFGTSDAAVSRGDLLERYDQSSDVNGAAPGVTLAGAIMALIAGVLLVGAGFIPMAVAWARFIGWAGGFLGVMGSFMMTISSAYWVGTGFTTLLNLIPGNAEPPVRFWIVSPVLALAAGIFLFITFFGIMQGVVAKRDGLRGQAERIRKGATFAMVLGVAVLVLPWSFQILEGTDRRDAGLCSGTETCAASYSFFTAYGHSEHETTTSAFTSESFGGILGIAEATKDDDPGLFQGLAFAIKVFVATSWVGVILGGVATFGHVFSSAFKFPLAAKVGRLFLAGDLVMILWSAIMFLLAASYMWKPTWDGDAFFGNAMDGQLWMPGFLSFAAGAILVFWGLNQISLVRETFGELPTVAAKGKSTVSFD